jgi:hypothetical protein
MILQSYLNGYEDNKDVKKMETKEKNGDSAYNFSPASIYVTGMQR